jgi:hypothetical protein
MHISSTSNLIKRINNLPKEINENIPNLASLTTGLATSLVSSYFAGSMISGAPNEVKAAIIPIIATYSAFLGSATSLITDKLAEKVFIDIEKDIKKGKIKED